MRNDNYKKRWIEIQVYQTLFDLLKAFKTLDKVLQFIKTLQPLTNFNYDIIEMILKKMLVDTRIKPIPREVVVAAYYSGYSVRGLMRKLHLSASSFYKHIEEDKKYQIYITKYITDTALLELDKYLNAFKMIREVGYE